MLKILSLIVPSIVILSLKRLNAEEAWVMQKNMRGNKKEQVPGTSKKEEEKGETRGKNGQVSGVELGVQRCPLERKKWTSVRK